MGDIVQFARGRAQRDPEQQAADLFEARLKGFPGIVPIPHRAAVRRLLGDWTAELNPAKPKAGLKVLMDAVKSENILSTFLLRRKRGVILPEVEEDTGNEKPLSSWNEYLAIAEMLLKLRRGNRGEVAFARERRARLSALMDVAEGKGRPLALSNGLEIGNLLGEIADTISERIKERTKLVDLWKALERLPFTVVWDENGNATALPTDSDNLKNASRMAEALPIFSQSDKRPSFSACAEEQNKYSSHIAGVIDDQSLFSSDYYGPLTGRHLQWALPRVRIGWLVKRCQDLVFVLPDQFKGLEWHLEDDWESSEEFTEWLETNRGSSEFPPDVGYNEEGKYGTMWNEYDFASELSIVIYPDENFNINISFTCIPTHGPLPVVGEFDIINFILNSNNEPWKSFYVNDKGERGLVLPSFMKEKFDLSDNDIELHDGVIIIDDSPFSFSLDMHNHYDDHKINYIYGRDLKSRFYPSIATNDSAPVGGPPGSVAAAMAANIHTAPGDQIGFIIEHQAKQIAELGLSFCSALYDYHASVLRQDNNGDTSKECRPPVI